MAKNETDIKELIETSDGESSAANVKKTTTKKGGVKKVSLSFKELKEEINDQALFLGTLAYLKKMKEYKDNPKEKVMTLDAFKKEIENFKKEKIYTTEEG